MLIGAMIVLGFPHLVLAKEYGHFAVGFAFVSIAGAIFYGWLQLSLIRLAGGTDRHHSPSLATVALGVILPLLPCVLLAWLMSLTGVLTAWLPSAIAAGGFNAATAIGQMARGLHRPSLYGAVGLARCICIFTAALIFTRISATQDALLYAVGLGSFIAALIGLAGTATTLKGDLKSATAVVGRVSLSKLISYGLPASLSLVAIMVMLNGDRFVLGLLCDPVVVAAYSAQSGVARQIIYPAISALGISIVPNALLLLRQDSEVAAIQAALEESGQILTILAPVLAIAIVSGGWIATVLLPHSYRVGAALVIPLSSIAAYAMGCRLVRYDPIFHVLLKPRAIAKCAFAALFVWAILLYPAVRFFGPIGAAAAGLAAAIAANCVAEVLIRRYRVSASVTPRKAVLCLAVITAIGFGIRLCLGNHVGGGLSLVAFGLIVALFMAQSRRRARVVAE
jgi:O-antigen/teichoic acid export membrane protein